jgi:signal transduction histidine kinase
MDLKHKLALRSTLVCAMTLLLVFSGTFYFFSNYVIQQYYRVLDERALTAAFIFLEKDEMNKQNYRSYEKKYLQTLNNEIIQIYDYTNHIAFVEEQSTFPTDPALLDRIRREGKHNFREDNRQFSGIFYKDNQGDFVILISGINSHGMAQIKSLFYLLLLFFVVGVIINYLFNLIVAGKTFRPFASVLQQVNTISAENLDERLPVIPGRKDELAALVGTLNMFLGRLEKEVNNQKRFLKNISHELKTPLTAIIGRAEIALEQGHTDYPHVLRKIISDTAGIQSVIEGLLLISGLQSGAPGPAESRFRIDELVWDTLGKLKFNYPNAVFHTSLDVGPDEEGQLEIFSRRELLATALINIVDNALKYSSNVAAEIIISIEDGHPLIIVRDNGPGIPEKEQDLVYDLFYRGSNIRHIPGQGIGLSLTRQILEFCKVNISIHSGPEVGTEVKLAF